MRFLPLQIGERWFAARWLEAWLEAERDQLVLWIPVLLGTGIAAWFVLPDPASWTGYMLGGAGIAAAGLILPLGGRTGRLLMIGGIVAALGCGLAWWRAERAAAPVLARPAVVAFTARVERVDALAARDLIRLRLAPVSRADLPPRVRVNLPSGDVPLGIARGAVVTLRARLMPPPGAALPGAYDYRRVAWFDGVGATGRGFAPVTLVTSGERAGADLRARLSGHIRDRLPGAGGAVAASLATGDQGAIPEETAEAMRRSGLAHLLSVSGLHITAAVGATMLLVLRLLALSPWAALHWRLPVIAAAAGALAAIGYTWLAGAEVPTVRSCVAALLVLAALVLGREAVTLRLVAAGALVVLLVWPEALVGASFQLSFAAVVAIVALHEGARVGGWFAPREEGGGRRLLRGLASLLLTGVVVELALLPIGLYHFHKAGLYGALANIVAIPLTTFVVMPLEAAALLLDGVGLGAPLWWLCGQALGLLLWIAHTVAAAPGSVAALPAMPGGAYALVIGGGLWLALWRTSVRWAGIGSVIIGLGWTVATPAPDLLITRDGRHLALRTAAGTALLRERAGDYVRDVLSEGAGIDGELPALDDVAGARCNADLCLATARSGARVLATRSGYFVDARALNRWCARVDVVVSERRLPVGCRPRLLRIDRPVLERSGGVAVTFSPPRVRTVEHAGDHHPWINPPTLAPTPSTTDRRWRGRRAAGRDRAGRFDARRTTASPPLR
ncbi:competence protein ComEC [Sphingomonas guangdongensis]|uniref:Competence protein ComEC n=2 Tax=Sphingomonas guangdongensis TaxID=1141890 RepID=A0A285QYG5_9SPHN|nr:ComEC/Rec2 family competence protein [Sphingomonas guangdongensis]SOB87015.1 competence protein ComEC [Sphingomonas guangdongensis]